MMKLSRFIGMIMLLVTLFYNCTPRDRYEKLVARELAKGERVDSLFMGLYLGMTDKDFYAHCWQLNKQGLIRQGTSNTSVLYKMKDLADPVEMNFYPNFYKKRIYEMPVKYNYEGWAPWNAHLSADSLQAEILELYKEKYGDDFMEVRHPERGTAYIKVDGNRRITIFKADERQVWAIFTDLLVENELRDLHDTENNQDLQKSEEVNPLGETLGESE
jgi:hypothetical protein